ncbi:MAG: RNA polymerase-associated protein RapA [Gammaproteobacteria bacterium]|nr:RNA polymerase-associated protein RapA [Gammaproteobacteria bacterium]MCW8992767.1 RNA polymerase-associated protein RapA [Gammaproteobacteria bacterium]
MDEFVPGQRWISDAELQLGLGTVLSVEQRRVTVLFLASGETRTYARQSAPLTRVVFAAGDTLRAHEGWSLKVEEVIEENGLLRYLGLREGGSAAELPEGQLDNQLQLNRPAERLFTGQFDADKWFALRLETLQQASRLARSPLRGLGGGRTSLIPHQLYIAHEVAGRYAPRVLLADEVGLGKTIEAGLILHQQLLSERARRVLIVVPESLQHQWLVEMLRRFNLLFSLFDEERCRAIEESSGQENPFQAEQLVLTAIGFLREHPERQRQALAGEWDLLVVDEAHHLAWSPEAPSREYRIVEQLAAVTRGVLLLTATPEQLGKESHFARLRLLDADRFPDFDSFLAEEAAYEPVAHAVEALLDGGPLDGAALTTLQATLEEDDNRPLLDTLNDPAAGAETQQQARLGLVEHLLDRHGTGRVLFRNTRAAVKGFPRREFLPCPLPLPDEYAAAISALQQSGVSEPQQLLCPEQLYRQNGAATPWPRIDPRVEWLIARLRELRREKVLVICASAGTVLALGEALRVQAGIHAALFHEGMSLIERDRAAAFFADPEHGTPVLLCSEIGSEGRNFQFAHQLVLFDLPLNPDLLEQRIGRLDRIGQSETIRIHVPYLEQSAQAVMVQWYHEGLGAFEQTCPAGHSVFVQVRETLIEALHQVDEGLADLPALIATTRQLHQALNEALHRGRDRLLEYNSCRPRQAMALRDAVAAADVDNALPDYLERVFDCYGIDTEVHSEQCLILHPSEQMQSSHFPGLNEEGITVTFDRATALANEEIHFLTWEHPLVSGAMEMVQGSELGNSGVCTAKLPGVEAGGLFMECLFVLESAAAEARELPPVPLRLVLDSDGRERASEPAFARIRPAGEAVEAQTAAKIVRAYREELRELLKRGEQLARQQAPELLRQAHAQRRHSLRDEVARLKALHRVNPNVRDEEIAFFQRQYQALEQAIESVTPRLDALRLIITL